MPCSLWEIRQHKNIMLQHQHHIIQVQNRTEGNKVIQKCYANKLVVWTALFFHLYIIPTLLENVVAIKRRLYFYDDIFLCSCQVGFHERLSVNGECNHFHKGHHFIVCIAMLKDKLWSHFIYIIRWVCYSALCTTKHNVTPHASYWLRSLSTRKRKKLIG